MKMRTVISFLIVLCVVSILNPTTSFAQDASMYMYWADPAANKIQRAHLDGTNVQDIAIGLGRPVDIAADIAGGKVYWTDRDRRDSRDPAGKNSIQRANLDGTNAETLISGGNSIKEYIVLDISGGKMYWTEWSQFSDSSIRRANLDGSNVEDLVTGLGPGLRGIALDLSGGKIYWADSAKEVLGGTTIGQINRANLDGSNIEDIISLESVHGIALDIAGGKIYWANPGPDKIQRANLDGSKLEDIVVDLNQPYGIALDSLSSKVYWTDPGADKIQRANLNGSNVEDLVTGLMSPIGIALGIPQVPAGLRFSPNTIADQTFTVGTYASVPLPVATGGTPPYTYSISALPRGLDFDATTQQLRGTPTTVVSGHPVTYTVRDTAGRTASLNFTITVQTTPPTNVYMYWVDWRGNKIQRANLDGSNVQDIVTGFGRPVDVTLDMVGGKMYWTDRDRFDHTDSAGRSSINRANLDGTNIETLILSGSSVKEYIALDIAGGKMYWTEWTHFDTGNTGKIQRANLDGSNVENLVTGLTWEVRGVALDISQGKMYWGDKDKLQCADLNGSNVQDILRTVYPRDIALDVVAGTIYWANWNAGKIQRANLDGSNVGDIVGGLQHPFGIALDRLNGKMYWTDVTLGKIQRANLDGSNLQDLVTGLMNPIGIALGIPQAPSGVHFSPNIIADQTFTVGTYASLNFPIAVGGIEPYTYTLTPQPPAGLLFDALNRAINGTPTTAMPATTYTYTVTDAAGQTAALTFTIEVAGAGNLDVNRDGQVSVIDLAIVALFYGRQVPVGVGSLPADVNTDGVVNLLDLTAVAQGIDAAGGVDQLSLQEAEAALLAAVVQGAEIEAIAEAPIGAGNVDHGIAYHNVAAALTDARHLVGTGDMRLGKGLTVLKALLRLLSEMGAIPETTALLPNYPNPFNPETWIPYHLSKDAAVRVAIYNVQGSVVRELRLGHQVAGIYESRGRAAYWDGRNQLGEKVASGVYFYTFTAGDFTATRKLLIAK